MLVNLSRAVGLNRDNPEVSFRAMILSLPWEPHPVMEADFELKSALVSKSGLHLGLRPLKSLIEYARFHSKKLGSHDEHVLPFFSGVIPMFPVSGPDSPSLKRRAETESGSGSEGRLEGKDPRTRISQNPRSSTVTSGMLERSSDPRVQKALMGDGADLGNHQRILREALLDVGIIQHIVGTADPKLFEAGPNMHRLANFLCFRKQIAERHLRIASDGSVVPGLQARPNPTDADASGYCGEGGAIEEGSRR